MESSVSVRKKEVKSGRIKMKKTWIMKIIGIIMLNEMQWKI